MTLKRAIISCLCSCIVGTSVAATTCVALEALLLTPTAVDVHFSPHGGCTDEVVHQINGARRSVRVLAYNFSSDRIRDGLLAAKKRGVDVRCVVDHVAASERGCIVPALVKVGIPCRLDKKHKIAHNKVMVIDEVVILTGSFNFSDSAETANAENLLTIKDGELAKRYLANWKEHWDHSAE